MYRKSTAKLIREYFKRIYSNKKKFKKISCSDVTMKLIIQKSIFSFKIKSMTKFFAIQSSFYQGNGQN